MPTFWALTSLILRLNQNTVSLNIQQLECTFSEFVLLRFLAIRKLNLILVWNSLNSAAFLSIPIYPTHYSN